MHSEPIALGAVEPVWPESPACQRTHSDSLGQVSIDDGLDVKRGKLGGERLAVRGKRSVCASDATPEPEGPESLAECPLVQLSGGGVPEVAARSVVFLLRRTGGTAISVADDGVRWGRALLSNRPSWLKLQGKSVSIRLLWGGTLC